MHKQLPRQRLVLLLRTISFLHDCVKSSLFVVRFRMVHARALLPGSRWLCSWSFLGKRSSSSRCYKDVQRFPDAFKEARRLARGSH